MDRAQAQAFACEWIAAWNSHDLARVLAHYADDFSMRSPFIVEIAGEPSGVLRGKAAVGAYWRKALERMPQLHFELLDVLVGGGSLVIHYRNHAGVRVAECLSVGDDGLAHQAAAHYSIRHENE